MQVLDYKYSEKPSQLQSSMFSAAPNILPSKQSTLSPSDLRTDMPMITPKKTSRRDLTQSPYKKPSWFSSFFNQVKTPAGKHYTVLAQCPLCCKYLSQLEH